MNLTREGRDLRNTELNDTLIQYSTLPKEYSGKIIEANAPFLKKIDRKNTGISYTDEFRPIIRKAAVAWVVEPETIIYAVGPRFDPTSSNFLLFLFF